MKEVKVRRSELLTVLETNRGLHQRIFEEALEGYRKKVIETLERQLAAARAGDRVPESIIIRRPVNQQAEYNRAIRMMEMSVEDEIVLSTNEFDAYVMDRWAWKQNFLSSNKMYSVTAASLDDSDNDD